MTDAQIANCGRWNTGPGECTSAKERCRKNMALYCQNTDFPERMATRPCMLSAQADMDGYREHLLKICAVTRKNSAGVVEYRTGVGNIFKDVCACHLPHEFYNTLAKNLQVELRVPNVSAIPECVYPDCSGSELRDTSASCPAYAITNCVQNISVDPSGSITVGKNIIINTDNIRQTTLGQGGDERSGDGGGCAPGNLPGCRCGCCS